MHSLVPSMQQQVTGPSGRQQFPELAPRPRTTGPSSFSAAGIAALTPTRARTMVAMSFMMIYGDFERWLRLAGYILKGVSLISFSFVHVTSTGAVTVG